MPQTFAQLTPELAVGQSRLFHTNQGGWIADRRAVLIDPGIFPDEIAALARWVVEQGATVAGIVLTHSHWDHILGPEHFPGVPVTAHAAYPVVMREHSAVPLKSIAAWEAKEGIARVTPFVVPWPTTTSWATARRRG